MPAKKKQEETEKKNAAKAFGKRDLTFFKKFILKEREALRTKLEVLRETAMETTLKDASGDNSSYAFHMADLGTDAQEREKAFLFVSREGQYLDKLDAALQRIDEGTYGVCRTCGDLIGKERLKAVPIATQCIKCKTQSSM